jgi:hypothetical protein
MHSRIFAYAVLALMIVAGFSVLGAGACSGNANDGTLAGNFLRYGEVEMVDFSVSGEAKCASCDTADIAGLYIELVSDVEPSAELAVETFDGPGLFHFSNLRAAAGSTMHVYGVMLFADKPESQALRAEAALTVPDDDDETVAVVLRFE